VLVGQKCRENLPRTREKACHLKRPDGSVRDDMAGKDADAKVKTEMRKLESKRVIGQWCQGDYKARFWRWSMRQKRLTGRKRIAGETERRVPIEGGRRRRRAMTMSPPSQAFCTSMQCRSSRVPRYNFRLLVQPSISNALFPRVSQR
jgi:hypothetical protein